MKNLIDLRSGLTRHLHQNLRKGLNQILLSDEIGMGKKFHITQVLEDRQSNQMLEIHVVLFNRRSKAQMTAQASYCLFDRAHSWALNPEAFEGSKEEKIRQALRNSTRKAIVFINNLHDYDTSMLSVLKSWQCPQVVFLCVSEKTKKQGVVDFVKTGDFKRIRITPIADKAMLEFARTLAARNNIKSRYLKKKMRALVKAAGGNPGKLVALLKEISLKQTEDSIRENIQDYLEMNSIYLFAEDYLIIVAIGGMSIAMLQHSLTYSLAILVTSVVLGGCSLVLYRLLTRMYKTDTHLEL